MRPSFFKTLSFTKRFVDKRHSRRRGRWSAEAVWLTLIGVFVVAVLGILVLDAVLFLHVRSDRRDGVAEMTSERGVIITEGDFEEVFDGLAERRARFEQFQSGTVVLVDPSL